MSVTFPDEGVSASGSYMIFGFGLTRSSQIAPNVFLKSTHTYVTFILNVLPWRPQRLLYPNYRFSSSICRHFYMSSPLWKTQYIAVLHTTSHYCTVSSLNCRWSLCNSLTHTETHKQISTCTLFNMWKKFSVRKDEKWKWDPWAFWQKCILTIFTASNTDCEISWGCVCVCLCMNVLYDTKGEGRDAKINLIKNLIASHQSLSKNNSHCLI